VNRSRKDSTDDLKENPGTKPVITALVLVLVSSAGLALGANLLVDNAVILARKFQISERIISVSLIALGTSIPELATSAIAAFKKETDISIGNIIGSNIFNIGFVLGLTGMIKPLEVNPLVLSFDIFWFLGAGIFLLVMVMAPRKMELQRWKGLTMLSAYLIYLYFVLANNTA
jgi:cation:H+ antiporter